MLAIAQRPGTVPSAWSPTSGPRWRAVAVTRWIPTLEAAEGREEHGENYDGGDDDDDDDDDDDSDDDEDSDDGLVVGVTDLPTGHVDHYEKKSAAYAVKYGRIRFVMLHLGSNISA